MKHTGSGLPWLFAPVIGLLSSGVLAQQSSKAPELSDIEILTRSISWSGIAMSAVVVLVVWILLRFVDNFVANVGTAVAERRLFLQRLNAFFRFFMYVFTVSVILLLGFEFSPKVLAIVGGATAVAVGFATRDLVASLVAGVMIIFDRPFQVGDRVRFGGEYGDILAIGLRSVKLRTLDDSTVTIPNNLFLSEVASSSNAGALEMQVVVDFHIGVDQDIHRARALVTEAAATSPYIHLPKPIVVRVRQITLNNCIALRLRLKAYVIDTEYESAFETDVSVRLSGAFASNGIYPPAVLYRDVSEVPLPAGAQH